MNSVSDMSLTFPNFPIRLSALKSLTFRNCIGWSNLSSSPRNMYKGALTQLYITDSYDMRDETMDFIMDWAVQSFNTTLESVYIYNNNLTRIPPLITLLNRLKFLDLKDNFFTHIFAGSFSFKEGTEIVLVTLSNCGIQQIQPGAFEGILCPIVFI